MTITRCIAFVLMVTALTASDAMAQLGYTGPGGCSKGMFWPFVRRPGDCLTAAEIREGMRGTYRSSEIVDDTTSSDSDSSSDSPQNSDASSAGDIANAPSTAEPAALSTSETDSSASAIRVSDQNSTENAQALDDPTPPGTPPGAPSLGQAETPRTSSNTGDATLVASPASPSPDADIRPASSPAQIENERGSEIESMSDNRLEYVGPGACTKGIFWPFIRRQGDCLTEAEMREGRTGTYE